MKIIPVFLPQFHRIPENDEWWGDGFTEWTNVKSAKPLFKSHYQPRVPLDKIYYDLSEIETLKIQCESAKKYGIFGFCFYHYWFNGKLLLEKPLEMLRENDDIDINYCISWANHNWENTWTASPGAEKTLIAHDFDDENDWIQHFNYFLNFFKDPRYIKEDNKPLLVILAPNIIGKLNKMLSLWNGMAIQAGFSGMKFISQSAMSQHSNNWDRSLFDYVIEFQPGYTNLRKNGWQKFLLISGLLNHTTKIKKYLGIKRRLAVPKNSLTFFDYDETWRKILSIKPSALNAIPAAFVDWDNTPRKGVRGSVCLGATPDKFYLYLKKLLHKTHTEYKQDKIFVFAWNEWGEGGYLEPDERYGYGYLRAIKNALQDHYSERSAI